MTAQTMKQTSMRLISQIDDKDTETMEKVVLFLIGIVRNKQKPKRELTPEQARKVALADKFCSAFAERQSRKEPRQLSQVIENLGNKDMLQYQCAVDSSCDCIVTINTKHFLPFCSIPLYKPDDMIALIDDYNLK